jgi:hypothetical protein
MLTIEKIKQECIDIDMQNIDAGDTYDVELFYANISLKELLTIYSQYMGLSCHKSDEPKDYRESYNLDILTIINEL